MKTDNLRERMTHALNTNLRSIVNALVNDIKEGDSYGYDPTIAVLFHNMNGDILSTQFPITGVSASITDNRGGFTQLGQKACIQMLSIVKANPSLGVQYPLLLYYFRHYVVPFDYQMGDIVKSPSNIIKIDGMNIVGQISQSVIHLNVKNDIYTLRTDLPNPFFIFCSEYKSDGNQQVLHDQEPGSPLMCFLIGFFNKMTESGLADNVMYYPLYMRPDTKKALSTPSTDLEEIQVQLLAWSLQKDRVTVYDKNWKN